MVSEVGLEIETIEVADIEWLAQVIRVIRCAEFTVF